MTHPAYDIHFGDALAVLLELDTGSVDALITDPPYSSGGQFRGDRTQGTGEKYVLARANTTDKGVDFTGDSRDQRAYAYWCALWLSEALRVVKPGGIAALFTDWRQLPATTDAIQSGGWIWRGIVPWWKPSHRPALGRYSNACEYVVWGSAGSLGTGEGQPSVQGFYSSDEPAEELEEAPTGHPGVPGYYQGSPPRDREHQTQKPVDVMRHLMRLVPEGGTVLDPFAGSGTTGVAAALEGRRFIGVEQHEHYVDVARDRISAAFEQRHRQAATVHQADLFEESTP